MQPQRTSAEQSHLDAGDGVERTGVQARGGVRRGASKVLVISTLLAVVAIGAIWMLSARPATRAAPSTSVSASGQTAALTSAPRSTTLKSPEWDQAHLGADGVEKCGAFRRVLNRVTALQGSGARAISASESTQLDTALNAAKAMPPASLTPAECGVPLG